MSKILFSETAPDLRDQLPEGDAVLPQFALERARVHSEHRRDTFEVAGTAGKAMPDVMSDASCDVIARIIVSDDTLKLNTSRRQGKLSKTASVTSNDPNMPNTTITLSCFVKEFITVTPSARINMVGYEGDELSQKLTIKAAEGQEFDITEVKTGLTDKLRYKVETVQQGKEYILDVASISKAAEIVRGQLELRTTSQKKPLIVFPVFIKIQSEVSVSPASVFFGRIEPAGATFDPSSLSKTVVVKKDRGDELSIKKVQESSKWIKISGR